MCILHACLLKGNPFTRQYYADNGKRSYKSYDSGSWDSDSYDYKRKRKGYDSTCSASTCSDLQQQVDGLKEELEQVHRVLDELKDNFTARM